MYYLISKILVTAVFITFALTYMIKKTQKQRDTKGLEYSEVVYDSNGFPRQLMLARQQQAARARAAQENYLLF